ncbi:tail assembly chaperone [Microbacterium phage Barnstormer]|uniref:Tail assembly chaperone n=1 Tax=Microbacterium phage Barnstormer TaxID=3028491 RepID=A0AAF0CJA8_9CAUD|nr:tail assembly chaperone [Microbacterium phage Barnstormer]WDS52119.1 tail assembly chaperone [Microbacterium phage UtzChips]
MAARKTSNPIAAEALSADIAFDFGGETYSTPPTSEWSLDALEAYEAGRNLATLREILSAEDYAKFRSRHNKVSDLNDVFVAIQRAQGISGKLTELAAKLRRHRDAVEADLLRFYGVDLGGLYRGELSLRRVSVLIANLPPDAALNRIGLPPSATGWDTNSFLLADVFAALTGKAHPLRPTAQTRAERYRSLRDRLEAQRARLNN